MRLLGIDYGARRVGLALSDPAGIIAVPHSVFDNDRYLLAKVLKLCEAEGVEQVVLGESLTFAGRPNPIMAKITKFKEGLEGQGLKVWLEPEYLTTSEANRETGEDNFSDARSAALILRSYLEKHHA
ncbi:MAG: hypothetical protein COV09_00275 [Candidatus Vogelbacteria bacterium CG10_big_fil_rev_8_21_14_0_10_50_13]|uniref:Putative pre-16S rRNA nuclease n=1 Tax=Candidatus Vogelbacteria bacterium CG10_big_fil_rev_8_21_14_0_10_50_13 TaxID=1975044 RepID=A0A2H0RHZ2_9BACT|nr:MAG: hypothetical protein COV09_00275 [Candidatus Vogelbacteria bacterium CG10_big_fil_rev_8_21_14_0_10_50_13]